MARLIKIRRAVSVIVISALSITISTVASAEPVAGNDGPAMDRNPHLWLHAVIVQRRGWVLDADDPDNLVKEGYYVLDKSARGQVIDVNALNSTCCVRFTDLTGWRRIELQVKKRLRRVTNYDDYGNVYTEQWVEEGLKVQAGDHGKITSGPDAAGVTVLFPIKTIGLAPPVVGDTVVRGPDWPRERRVDGCKGSESEAICTGTVIADLDRDFYLGVRWHKTGLNENHRFDCRRHYDVVLEPVLK